ncbi:MAG TPA: YegS/Rv2252/BmrU family lipid kinase [Candidatus Baltobacteraceae bacterium]|nr:YegS/Rv2252/BmrU family lipid kinase [Candidatus Baltobacteraceae bacterium]
MRALVVLNEKSRRGEREGALVCRTLEALGIACERDPGAAGMEAVVAAGGDGTVISTIPMAIERGIPLGIVPLGTFNDLARTLGVPLSIDRACEVIAQTQTRAIDVGLVNGVYFVNEASVGLSTRIARRQTPEVKKRFGLLAIIATAFQSLRTVRRFTVHLSSSSGPAEEFKTIQLTIANSPRFGGVIERPDAALDDGWLDLYSVEPESWLQTFRIARKIVARDASSGEGLRTRRATWFDVHTHRPHHVTADGEPAGTTPAIFKVVPKAVRIIVPNAAACDTEISDIPASSSPSSDSVLG